MHARFICALALAATCFVPRLAAATVPLWDLLDYNGERRATWLNGRWLDFPRNEKTVQIAREFRCSAIGAPRGLWRVSGDRLLLTGFRHCGADVALEQVYEGQTSPIFADWITGTLVSERGKYLCHGGSMRQSISEKRLVVKVVAGVIESLVEENNAKHPSIPTLETATRYVKKHGLKEEMISQIASSGRCLPFERDDAAK